MVIAILMLFMAFMFVCALFLSDWDEVLEFVFGAFIMCLVQVIGILVYNYIDSTDYMNSSYGSCYEDWAGNKMFISEYGDKIKITDYNTPNDTLNYFTKVTINEVK